MAIEFQTQTINLNQSYTFTFSATVCSVVYGIGGFSLTCGDGDIPIGLMGIALEPLICGSNVTISVKTIMTNFYFIPPSNGEIWVCVNVLAVTGNYDSGLTLANFKQINNSPCYFSGESPYPLLCAPVLSGFNFSFNYAMQPLQIEVGVNVSGINNNCVQLNGDASMYDQSGNQVSYDSLLSSVNFNQIGLTAFSGNTDPESSMDNSPTTSIDAGVIINCDPSLTLRLIPFNNLQNTIQPIQFPADIDLGSNYGFFLTRICVSFGGGTAAIQTFGVSAEWAQSPSQVQGNPNLQIDFQANVTLQYNNSPKQTDDSSISYVNGFVIGWAS